MVSTADYSDWGIKRTIREAENVARWNPWKAHEWMNEARDRMDLDNMFFDEYDRPLVLSSWLVSNASTWTSAASYTQASYVSYSGKYYRAELNHTSSTSNEPTDGTGHWIEVKPYVDYSSATTYSQGSLVKANVTVNGKALTTIWKSLTNNNQNNAPAITSPHWEREELCGKKISSCKCRFQATVVDPDSTGSAPTSRKNTSNSLPFGSFPGTGKF